MWKRTKTISLLRNFWAYNAFLSTLEPRSHFEALEDVDEILAIQDELKQFERNKVWQLEPRQEHQKVEGLKWVFKNKMDKHGTIVGNKASWVVKGYNQQKGIDFEETFVVVVRLEAIRILIAFLLTWVLLYQMVVKCDFLSGYYDENVYVEQPPWFENFEMTNHVCKIEKALYGLKQAHKAMYERLSIFLLEKEFKKGKVYVTLF